MSHPVVITRRGAYHDSVKLMLVSTAASAVIGADDVAVAMATPLNVRLIQDRGFDLSGVGELSSGDLVIAIRAQDAAVADRVLTVVDEELSGGGAAGAQPAGTSLLASGSEAHGGSQARSVLAAARRNLPMNLAVISVPGSYAAYEAARALDAGLHVFCFSNGVSVEQEIALKRQALDRGLLLMGPDCGTSIIDGIALGFANAVARGPVGIVGASGTGIQEVCCLLDACGVGISHAIGVGGRDLTGEVGGVMTRRALELLTGDAATEVIIVISKSTDPDVADALTALSAVAGKPVVLAFLGLGGSPTAPAGVHRAASIETAAVIAASLVGHCLAADVVPAAVRATPGSIRGLYSGGTLLLEASGIFAAAAGAPRGSGDPGHTFVDFGSQELTAGRAHPMIDPTLRLANLRREAADPSVGVILLDVVLGYGAHPDPASVYAPVIAEILGEREGLTVIVSLCGTALDPQNLERQRERLAAAGAVVLRGAAAAARTARAASEVASDHV